MAMSQKLNIDNGLQDWKTEQQAVTAYIVHLADSANIKGITSSKLGGGLTSSYFESPNDTIHTKRYVAFLTLILHS